MSCSRRRARRLFSAPLVLAGLSLATPAAAAVADELRGVRSYGMGNAAHALFLGNDAIYANPAAMAAAPRYDIELAYGYEELSEQAQFNVSAVDSKSGPVAGALAYTFDRGSKSGYDTGVSRLYAAIAYSLAQGLAVGMTHRYLRGEIEEAGVTEDVAGYSMDLGLMASLGESLAAGFTYHHLVHRRARRWLRPALGFGLGYNGLPFTAAVDATLDISEGSERQLVWHGGVEYRLAAAVPVRLGYERAPFIKKSGEQANENIVSGGLGFATQSGSIELGYRRSTERERNWGVVAALRLSI